MYSKVLVPLDGSELAECALPEVIKLRQGGIVGEVVLMKVIDIDVFTLPKTYERDFDFTPLLNAQRAESGKYLEGIQSRLQSARIQVRTELLEGRPAEKIVDYVRNHAVDLIVIATHGYSGMRRLMFGSVAIRVLHDAHVPVLLIRPASCREKH